MSLLNIFSKLFEFVIHNHVSHYLNFEISPYQRCFSKSKSAVTNSVTYVDSVSPLVESQRQADAIYFDLSYAFNFFSHSLILHKRSVSGLLVTI
jgi:hypothetical protein